MNSITQVNRNIEMLVLIADKLEELCNEVTFVGGCIVGLLITDKAAPDVRFTLDVDCIINIITLIDYHKLGKKLHSKGFRQTATGNHPICRWEYSGIFVDVMPIDKSVLGFSNRWYKEALENAVSKTIKKSLAIRIITAPYFLATKLEAFKDRGNNDFVASHDLEDIIAVLDGTPEIVKEVANCSPELKKYLSLEFSLLFNNKDFMYALPGSLNYSGESLNREKVVSERIKGIIGE
jgi:predicted nucleotidyltransferase